jgi:hypothetical protein
MEFPLNGFESDRQPLAEGVVLGKYLDGDDALSVVGSKAIITDKTFKKHFALIGATGGGKSSTVRAIIHGVTQRELQQKQEKEEGKISDFEETDVIVFDANAHLEMAMLLGGCRAALGYPTLCFPRQRIDAWPGDWMAVFNRLLEIIPFSKRGDGAYYTDAETVVLQLACRLGGVPPRSSKDLLDRIDFHRISKGFGVESLEGITEELVEALHMRVRAVLAHCGWALDGELSFADVRSAYFGMDTLTLGESNEKIMRMLLSQLSFYIEHEKPANRRLIVVIDEFAAFAGQVEVGKFIEHARKLGVCVIIISQTVAGIGDPVQILRILENSGVVMVHSTAAWEELLRYIGAEEFPEITWRFDPTGGLESEMARMSERPKVRRSDLLALPVGHIWVFRKNKAMLVKVELPDTRNYGPFELPEQERLFPDAKAVDESEVSIVKKEEPPSEHGEASGDPPPTQGRGSEDAPLEHGQAPDPQAKDESAVEAEGQAEKAQPSEDDQRGRAEPQERGSDPDSEAVVDEKPDWDNVELPDGPDLGDLAEPDQE